MCKLDFFDFIDSSLSAPSSDKNSLNINAYGIFIEIFEIIYVVFLSELFMISPKLLRNDLINRIFDNMKVPLACESVTYFLINPYHKRSPIKYIELAFQ